MMSRFKRVLKHAVTGYIPQGTKNDVPPPGLKQITEEPKVTVAEPLKQEIPQELSKMPEEEHDEQELKDDDGKPDCFANADGEGGYDEDDARCQHCDLSDDCQSEASDDDDSGEEEPEEPEESKEEPKKVQKKAEPEEDSKEEKPKPDKFTIFKIMRTRVTREDGSVNFINSPRTIGETYSGEPPTKATIENVLVPLYGGGVYSIMNQSTKQVAGKYQFDGNPKDPDEPMPATPQQVQMGPIMQGPGTMPVGGAVQQAMQGQQQNPALDRIQWAMAQGSQRAVDQLAQLAEKYAETGDTEKLNVVVGALKEIATGKRESSSSDKFMEFLMADRQNQQTLLNNLILEGKKGKEASSSDIVRETMSTMKEMFSLAKEFAPGEDTGVQMVREVSGVVKDGLKEVTDTVIQVTGSKPLKQVEGPPRYVYKCERCKGEVQPFFKACPSCGLVFKPGVITTPPPAPASVPVETFEKPAPPLPAEVRDKMGYLKRLAVFIQYEHDAAVKGSAFFKQADPESRLMLLFTANFGYNNIMKLVAPWRTSKEIPEGEAIFRTVESPNGRLWINTFFGAIKNAAKEESITLDDGTIEKYLDEINRYSPVRFNYKPKPKPPTAAPAPVPPVVKKVKGEEVAVSVCPVCNKPVPTLQLKDHLFSEHPEGAAKAQKVNKVNERIKAAIAKGAAVLPRTGGPVESPLEEPLVPDAEDDGTEE